MRLKRRPPPALLPFIQSVWLVDEAFAPRPTAGREHVLPTGGMHLVFRLSDHLVHLFSDFEDTAGRTFGCAVVGGPRAGFYVKDVSEPSCSVGVQLRPGVAQVLFGAPAGELAGRHTRLDDLWGRSANSAREQIQEARTPERRLEALESLLAARLPHVRALHPAVAMALERFREDAEVRDVVADSGYSHRRFIALFREAVGLAPKLYCRVRRFQKAVACIFSNRQAPWTDVALSAGYSDQAHFNRDFLEFAGLTPGEYRRISPDLPNHVAVS